MGAKVGANVRESWKNVRETERRPVWLEQTGEGERLVGEIRETGRKGLDCTRPQDSWALERSVGFSLNAMRTHWNVLNKRRMRSDFEKSIPCAA